MKTFCAATLKHILLSLGLCGLAFVAAPRGASATVVNAFYFTGNGYVCGGQTETLTPAEGYTFTASGNYQNGASLSVIQTGYTTWWYVDFAALGSQTLTPGYYPSATRYPFNTGFNGQPATNGLSFDGDGRGDNMLSGEFFVFDIQYGASGTITSLAADFIQYDENQLNWKNFGSIRYNSAVPLDTPAAVPATVVPEPSCALLLIGGAGFLGLLRRRRSKA